MSWSTLVFIAGLCPALGLRDVKMKSGDYITHVRSEVTREFGYSHPGSLVNESNALTHHKRRRIRDALSSSGDQIFLPLTQPLPIAPGKLFHSLPPDLAQSRVNRSLHRTISKGDWRDLINLDSTWARAASSPTIDVTTLIVCSVVVGLVMLLVPVFIWLIMRQLEKPEKGAGSAAFPRRLSRQRASTSAALGLSTKESLGPVAGRSAACLQSRFVSTSSTNGTPSSRMCGDPRLIPLSLESLPSMAQPVGSDIVPLCPHFVVPKLGGVVLVLPFRLLHTAQDAVAEVKTSGLGADDTFARLVMCEHEGRGVMLETTTEKPVAHLDTSHALVDGCGKPRYANRYAVLRRAPPAVSQDGQGAPCAVFHLTKTNTGGLLVARRGGETTRPFLSADVDPLGGVLRIADASGRQCAVAETAPSGVEVGDGATMLRVFHGVDASLMLLTAVAARKLR